MTAYSVMVVITGVTTNGTRYGLVKNSDGTALRFPTEAEADAEAERLNAQNTLRGGTTPSGRPIANRYYHAVAEVL